VAVLITHQDLSKPWEAILSHCPVWSLALHCGTRRRVNKQPASTIFRKRELIKILFLKNQSGLIRQRFIEKSLRQARGKTMPIPATAQRRFL
jgi:hypothetical protein